MTSREPYEPTGGRQATAREFLSVLFRRKWVVIGLFLVTTLTVAILSLSQGAEYISSGKVMVKRGEQESMLTPTRRYPGQWEEDLGSEVQLAKSQSVLDLAERTLTAQTAAGQPVVKLDPKKVDAEVIGKSNVLAIAYVDADPKVARRVCDALLRAYVEFRQNDLALAYPREFFDRERQEVETDLNHWTELRRRFANSEEIYDIGEQQRSLINQVGVLESRRSDVAADLAEARAEWEQMQQLSSSQDVDLPSFAKLYSSESAVLTTKKKVIDQEAVVAQLQARFQDNSPQVVQAMVTLESYREMLRREVESQIKMSKSRVDVLEARLAAYDRDIAALRSGLGTMPDKEAHLGAMNQEIERLKSRLMTIEEKSDAARVNERTSARTNVVLIAAAGPATAARTRDYVRLALAPAFSLVVGIGLAFFLDGLDVTVRTSGHAEEAVELPVLAAVTERRRVAR